MPDIIYTVGVGSGLRYDCEAPDGALYKVGEAVVIQRERCQDNGVISVLRKLEEKGGGRQEPRPAAANDQDKSHKGQERSDNGRRQLSRILRRLNLKDQGRVHEKQAREHSMLQTAARKVREHNLPMKLLNCHYTFDRSMACFQFVAEGRVDFRNLVKDLSGALHTRVELRQIGVRDEASLVGGIGCCGRPFCCATILEKFPAVNVRAAKDQRLSLNPNSVSGSCGRLKCCLRYELEGYREMNRQLPRVNTRCETAEGCGKIVDCNALTRCARVRLDGESGRCLDLPVDEIRIEARNRK